MSSELKVLSGNDQKKKEGDFVLKGQVMDKDFSHVNASWLSKTLTYDQGLEALEKDKAKTKDFVVSLSSIKFTVNSNDKFIISSSAGEFHPTKYAVGQMAGWADCGLFLPQRLNEHLLDPETEEIVQLRDRQDAETLVAIMNNGMRHVDQSKKFLWRVREDGTLRAMLTEIYAKIDNRWFIEVLRKLVPTGRLSHWNGDCDTIYGNVLIPDSIRTESDSDYGGMLSVGNSEIGERRLSSLPSIFRAICCNGNIWGRTKGFAIKQVHRGKIDLKKLYDNIKENLNKQIPLLPQGIDLLLKTKAITWKGSPQPVIAAVAKEFKLSKKQATETLKGYNKEPDFFNTAFGLINGVTRASQNFGNEVWVNMDTIGGRLTTMPVGDWNSLITIAKNMKAEDVEAAFVNAV